MEKYIYNKQTGLHYELVGDYYYPCLMVPKTPCIGIWGMRRLQYLKEQNKVLYQTLLLTDKLKVHLEEVDSCAEEMFATLVKQISACEGVNEVLKSIDQMEWISKMNSIHNRAKEVVYQKLIYA